MIAILLKTGSDVKEATKVIDVFANKNDHQVDSKVVEFIMIASTGTLSRATGLQSSNGVEPLLLKISDADKKQGIRQVTIWRLVDTRAIHPFEIFEGASLHTYRPFPNDFEQQLTPFWKLECSQTYQGEIKTHRSSGGFDDQAIKR